MQPLRGDDPHHAEHEEHHRQLEDQAETDHHHKYEADQLADVGEIRHVGWRELVQYGYVERHREDRRRHAEGEEADRCDEYGQDESALAAMEPRAHEPPDLLDHHRGGEHEADIDRNLQLGEDASRRTEVHRVADPGALDQEADDLARDEERDDRRHRPRAHGDHQGAAERLEMLDDRHPLLLDRSSASRSALKDPV